MNIVVSGQKTFGKEVLKICEKLGFNILAVVSPVDDYTLTSYAVEAGYRIIPAGTLKAEIMPDDCDLGITAHSFDYVGRATRYKTRLGWLGYHPSLLPRHRGRSSIEWALRMKDVITGGSLFWLNAGIDRGDIAYQDWVWLDHRKTAKEVWKEQLMPLGLQLFEKALVEIKNGIIKRVPQSDFSEFQTFEPGLDNVKDVYKPDLLMLPSADCYKSVHL